MALTGTRLAQSLARVVPLGGSTPYRVSQLRRFNIHEYQSVHIMNRYGILTPKGGSAHSPREAREVVESLKKEMGDVDFIVKAQVLAGGRGLGKFKSPPLEGGVHVCTSAKQVCDYAEQMIGNTLVTTQTGPEGKICKTLLICERVYIRRERYFAILMDRTVQGPLLVGSSEGGTDIEEIALRHPEAIKKMAIDIATGLTDEQAKEFAKRIGFESTKVDEAADAFMKLYKMFIEKDCTQIEINPFAELSDGRVMVCDAKVNFDDNAEFRQKSLFEKKDASQHDPRETYAEQHGLNYVGLDGNIGCMVNGAGLAMATMDMIAYYNGQPANFLDVGGGASQSQVVEALRILQNDPKVQSIFINIFGGIMRCDVIALGIVHATQEVHLSKPLVVRLQGTNQEEAKTILEESGLRLMYSSDFDEAARKVVKMAAILDLAQSAALDVSFAM
eukprot:GHVN01101898.1.p1 GENE.GHVN01101898.1~~GHVN01101898.1.p1  ORF type:complete len:446 (+),score=76.63 GHVN01101898.1:58-1395(+)